MKLLFRLIITSLILIFSSLNLKSQDKGHWVDSVMNTLTLKEKIGQLLMVRANQPGNKYDRNIESYIDEYGIGGVTFFAGDPEEQVKVTNEWQINSKVPLLISIDGEWGLRMRLENTPGFPYQMTLGAIDEDTLIYLMGKEIGEQFRRMGIHMNFAPVVDINSNPANPVIHLRSFGEEVGNVTEKSLAYMKGMQDAGLIAVAKHFPGHGDTDTDSHKTLPVIEKSRQELDSLELVPFKELIREGVDGVMIAHLYIPEIESEENLASTLSEKIVTGLLKQELGFEGLVISDALDMKGVTKFHKPGDIEVKAFLAGNDILLLPADVPEAMEALLEAVEEGRISSEMVDTRCRKVLEYKYKAGLDKFTPVAGENLLNELNTMRSKQLNQVLAEKAVTLIRNNDSILPLKRIDTLDIAVLSNKRELSDLQKNISYYTSTDNFFISESPREKEKVRMIADLEPYNLVIVAMHTSSAWNTEDYGIPEEFIEFVYELSLEKKVVLAIFGSPYLAGRIKGVNNIEAIVMSYQNSALMEAVSAQMIFGGIPFSGRLPVTASVDFPEGLGISTTKTRLHFASPERLGISGESLYRADSIIKEGIDIKAFPGCQVLAAKDGIVFYNRSTGHQTYNKKLPVEENTIYDVASLTKVAATALAVMELSEESIIDIDYPLSYYLTYLRNTDKEHLIIRDIMAHQSRFRNWIPYFRHTLKDGKLNPSIYSDELTESHTVRVAEELYITNAYKHSIIDSILRSPLRKNDSYLYSDLGYYLLKEAMEQALNRPYDKWLEKNFYNPLGLDHTGFHPRQKWDLERIAPTENDREFRKQLVHGDVHDQGAAMLGGVSGHAGLFSNAKDMAVVMQMLLDGGRYGGIRYLEQETIKEFTKTQFPLNGNRRGIGFDKPLFEYEADGPNCKSASPSSFGHSGFTGTYMWADPANGLVYVFLSNRVYPDASNNKISKLNIRTNLHQVFYEAIEKSENFADFQN